MYVLSPDRRFQLRIKGIPGRRTDDAGELAFESHAGVFRGQQHRYRAGILSCVPGYMNGEAESVQGGESRNLSMGRWWANRKSAIARHRGQQWVGDSFPDDVRYWAPRIP